MSLDITTTYIDTVTGYLHVSLNELFKLKANYTVLEHDYTELIASQANIEKERSELSVALMESQKRFEELSNVSGTNQKLNDEIKNLNYDKDRMEKKLAHMDTFARQINDNNATIEGLNRTIEELNRNIENSNAEVSKYIEMVAALRIQLDDALKNNVPVEVPSIEKLEEPVVADKKVTKKKKTTK